MAQIFRVERTKNFTVMSNHHFKNKNLTLKAKGLLSLMLSLPEDWNYNRINEQEQLEEEIKDVRDQNSKLQMIAEAIKRYKKMWDKISQMFLLGSLSGIAVLGDVIREYLLVNLIVLFVFVNMGIILIRMYLRKSM